MICDSLGQKKDVVKSNQENQGGFPQYISSRMSPIGEDTGIDWSGHEKVSFEVASFLCNEVPKCVAKVPEKYFNLMIG